MASLRPEAPGLRTDPTHLGCHSLPAFSVGVLLRLLSWFAVTDSRFVWGQCPLWSPSFCWLPTSTAACLLTGMRLPKACCEIGSLPGEAGAAAPWPGRPRPVLGPVLPHTVQKHSGTSSVRFLHNCISPKGIRPVVNYFRPKVRGSVGRCELVEGHLLQVADGSAQVCPDIPG